MVTAAVQQTVDLRLGKQGSAVHQDDVASHSQSRRGLRQTHRFRKCLAVGHQRCRTHETVFVGLDDGTIHARRETKIVGVDDQAAHRASLAGMCRVNATSSRLESSAGILPAVPRASRPRRGGRHARRHSRRDGGATKTCASRQLLLLGPDPCPSRFLRPADCGPALGAQRTTRPLL